MVSFKKLVYFAVIPAFLVTTLIYSVSGVGTGDVLTTTILVTGNSDKESEGDEDSNNPKWIGEDSNTSESSLSDKDDSKGSTTGEESDTNKVGEASPEAPSVDSNKEQDSSLANTNNSEEEGKGTETDKDNKDQGVSSSSSESNPPSKVDTDKNKPSLSDSSKDSVASSDATVTPIEGSSSKDTGLSTDQAFSKQRGPSYEKILRDLNHWVKLVGEETTLGSLQAILLQNELIDYRPRKLYEKNEMFPGSPEIYLKSKEIRVDGKRLTVLDMREEANKFRRACINYLNSSPEGDADLTQVRKWCILPTIKEALKGQGLDMYEDSTTFKETGTLQSEWLYDQDRAFSKYVRKLNFVKKMHFEDAGTFEARSYFVYFNYRLNGYSPYELIDFPSTTLEGMSKFQKTTLFAYLPFTAGDYLAKKYGITKFKPITEADKDHFFYQEGMSIEDYKKITNQQAFNGKSVWGAIKFLFDKRAD